MTIKTVLDDEEYKDHDNSKDSRRRRRWTDDPLFIS